MFYDGKCSVVSITMLPVPEIAKSVAAKEKRPKLRGVPDVVATCVAIPAVIVLFFSAQTGLATFSAAAFGVGLVAVLGMSAVYHTPNWNPRRLWIVRRCDHAAIFVLLAGSYTPFCLCTELPLGREMLAAVWGVSAIGVARCLFFPQGRRWLRAGLFVVLGAAMIPSAPALYRVAGSSIFLLCVIGGALYVIGAAIYVAKRPNPIPTHFGYQEVFHLFVFAGAGCHYVAVWQVVVGA